MISDVAGMARAAVEMPIDRMRYLCLSTALAVMAWALHTAVRQLPYDVSSVAIHAVPIVYGSLSFDLQCRRARDAGWGMRYVVASCAALMLAVVCFAYGMFGPSSDLPHPPLGTASGILFVSIYLGMQICLFARPSAE